MTLDEFKKLSNFELIELFKNAGYSATNLNKKFGFCRNTAERLFDKRGIDRSRLVEEHNQQLIEEYNKNPKLCMYCGNAIPWEKRNSNVFCNNSCAASKNNMGTVRNKVGNIESLHITRLSEILGHDLSEEERKEWVQ